MIRTTSFATTSGASTRPANGPGCSCRRALITPTTTSRCRWPWKPAPRASWVVERSGRSTSSRTAREARSQFAATTAFKRVADVNTVVREHGTPWYARYGLTKESLASIRATEGWHARYGSCLGSADGTAPSKAGTGRSLLSMVPPTSVHTSAPLEERRECEGLATPAHGHDALPRARSPARARFDRRKAGQGRGEARFARASGGA